MDAGNAVCDLREDMHSRKYSYSMDFKFNFMVDKCHEDEVEDTIKERETNINNKDELHHKLKPFRHINLKDIQQEWLSCKDQLHEMEKINLSFSRSLEHMYIVTPCSYVNKRDVINSPLKRRDSLPSTVSDLIPTVYEGGFEVWECTIDILKFLEKHEKAPNLEGKNVLDLGCGVGLLGIYALIQGGANRVDFQDYNEEVLLKTTGPTLLANWHYFKKVVRPQDGRKDRKGSPPPTKKMKVTPPLDNDECPSEDKDSDDGMIDRTNVLADVMNECCLNLKENFEINFYAGDWQNISTELQRDDKGAKYDIILSAETIYNPNYHEKLHDFLQNSLADNGTAYIGTKSHYFGVGGGVETWREFVQAAGVFDIDMIEAYESNLQRLILVMSFKRSGVGSDEI